MSLNHFINELLSYGLKTKILEISDYTFCLNQLLDLFQEKEFSKEECEIREIEEILNDLTKAALKKGILPSDDIIIQDNFKAKVMNIIIDRPNTVITKFFDYYKKSPQSATDYLYRLEIDSNYIQTKRIAQNIKWDYLTEYGKIELTINVSKPEKDPKWIAEQKAKAIGYPKCQLCLENEGFHGHEHYESRANLRIIPLTLNNEQWYFQYSPYSYFNEHSIVLRDIHSPMVVNPGTFKKLIEFLDYFPEYFVGSNAGLPIVGGSILNHEHFQSGRYHFPIEDAKEEFIQEKNEVRISVLIWPLSTIRIISKNKNNLILTASSFLQAWQNYHNEKLSIINTSENIHNTITPIARKKDEDYAFDLILRNNHTNDTYPDGVFHPHKQLHHIKKENIGLIEAMGLGILPSRLRSEFELIKQFLLGDESIYWDQKLEKHRHWIDQIKRKWNRKDSPDCFILQEAGQVFSNVLKDSGVFKMDKEGHDAFVLFVKSVL